MKESELVKLFYGAAADKGAETTTSAKRGKLSAKRKAAPADDSDAALLATLDSAETTVSHNRKIEGADGEEATKATVAAKNLATIRRRVLLLGMLRQPIPDSLRAELAEAEALASK